MNSQIRRTLLFSAGVYRLMMFLSHGAAMAVRAFQNVIESRELLGVAAMVIIGLALIALVPAKRLAV